MQQASFEITEFKAVGDGPRGLFAAKVSAFGNVDKNGDRIMPTAFDNSIAKLRAKSQTIPVIWSHEHRNPEAYIGEVNPNDVAVTKEGLIVAGKMDIDSNPVAAKVFELLAKGRIKEWSFGYEVKDETRNTKDLARELNEVDLIEVGPTLRGANGETATLALKEVLDVVENKAVDGSEWDGNRAMSACSSASDYRSICAGEHNAGDPDQRAHWALPHHYLGRGPNAAGVRNALSRLPQTQDLKNRGAAESHLNGHMSEINPESAAEPEVKLDPIVGEALTKFDAAIDSLIEEKIGRVISAKTEGAIARAMSALQEILDSLGKEVAEEAGSSPEVKEALDGATDGEDERLRRELSEVGLFLSERNR